MGTDGTEIESGTVAVTRRIDAPANVIFKVLADPKRHLEIDGTGMLRGARTEAVVTGVGEVFVMKMFIDRLGDYEMNNFVSQFEVNRRIGWEPAPGRGHPNDINLKTPVGSPPGHQWSYELTPEGANATMVTETFDCSRAPKALRQAVNGGQNWIDGMTRTLELLNDLCTGDSGAAETDGAANDGAATDGAATGGDATGGDVA
jgi:hypothetical protein